MGSDCVFCQIVEGKIPSHKIWEDDKHFAFLSIFPNTEGFSLVATKKHWPSYAFKNNDDVLRDLTTATKKVALLLDTAFEDVGRTGMFFEGFGVDHLHSKLFPMHGTANMSEWKHIDSKMKVFFKKYPGYLSSHDADRMKEEKLKQIAAKINDVVKNS